MNTGSFNANGSGNGSAIMDAMTRLGIGQGSVLNQNPTSPNSVAPAQVLAGGQPPMPSGDMSAPVSAAPMEPSGQPGGMQPAQGNPENQIILRALDQKLKSNAAIEKAQAGIMGGK